LHKEADRNLSHSYLRFTLSRVFAAHIAVIKMVVVEVVMSTKTTTTIMKMILMMLLLTMTKLLILTMLIMVVTLFLHCARSQLRIRYRKSRNTM